MLENQFLREMGLETAVHRTDERRVELVVKGLPLFHGVPLALDATVVSPLRADGTARPHADTTEGVALEHAEDLKARTYPELVHSARVRMVVLACEVGGRWSEASLRFVRGLAAYRARSAPRALRRSVEQAWQARWWGILAVAVQDALCSTLVDDAPRFLHGRPPHDPDLADLLLDAEPAAPLPPALQADDREDAEAPAPIRLPLR